MLIIRVLKVPQNVVVFTAFQENVGRIWTNAQFQILIDICEEKYWKYNHKAFKEANCKEFMKQVNMHFSNMQQSWKQMQEKWNKMKEEYEFERY